VEELNRDRTALSLAEAKKYTAELFEQKCGVLFQHVLEKYPDRGRSVYGEAG
jgi:hypothetical protein